MSANSFPGATTAAPTDADRLPRTVDGSLSATGPQTLVEVRARGAQRTERIAWYACIGTLTIWAVTYVAWPFSNDQGNLAWVGSTILAGGMPYRDAWDVKGPGAHLLFALAQLLFGRNEWGVRVFDLLMLAAGAACVRRIVLEYASRSAGRWAIVLYLLWYASLNHHNTAQPDGWAAVLITVAVTLLLTRARLSVVSGGLAGALFALCALIKPTYALFLALPLVDGATRLREKPGEVLRFWSAVGVGFVTPIALCIAWFYARGALGDWIAVHLHWIPSSYTQVDAAWLNRVQDLIEFLTMQQFAPVVPFAIGGLYVVRQRTGAGALVLVAWLIVAVLGVLIQGHFYPYHWHPAYPPLALLGGLGLDAVWTWLRSPSTEKTDRRDTVHNERDGLSVAPVIGSALAAILLVGAVIGPALHDYRFAKSLATDGGAAEYDRIEFGPFGHHGGAFSELVDYLRARSSPEDTVLVWGSTAGVNYLSARSAVAPFGFIQPLVDPPDTELRRHYREQFMWRLTSAPPRYVVALNEAACARDPSPAERQLMGRAEGLVRCLTDLPEVKQFVSRHYVLDRAIGPLELWRLR